MQLTLQASASPIEASWLTNLSFAWKLDMWVSYITNYHNSNIATLNLLCFCSGTINPFIYYLCTVQYMQQTNQNHATLYTVITAFTQQLSY